MRKRLLEIRGLAVTLWSTQKCQQQKQCLIRRKIVAPEFVELWYIVNAGKFDPSLWASLNQVDKDFFALCVHQCQVDNPAFEQHLARDFRGIYDRLRVIESTIAAGNLNEDLVNEFKTIVDRLSASHQIPKKQATNLKNRIDRTYASTHQAASEFARAG